MLLTLLGILTASKETCITETLHTMSVTCIMAFLHLLVSLLPQNHHNHKVY